MRVLHFIAPLLIVLLAGCSTLQEKDDSELTANELYERAKKALDIKDYEIAITHFDTLETRFPFGIYAQHAQLNSAYAYYKFNESASAIANADRFIKTYPRHEHVDYAYYLRGLAKFNQGKDNLDRMFNLDVTKRESGSIQASFFYFKEVVERFPDSRYSPDSRQRMVHLRNLLAQAELHVASYYLSREAFTAAANRAKYIIETLPRTPAIPQALTIMATAYQQLGLPSLANDALRVRQINFPDYTPPSAM
ncbi:MAG: outer membrane protein assembly factor BamD [Thiotrichaceae bacterium]|nr:outer membrane protein assembly factor BamD [Thiotrichaceae bacterium]PCI14535.1 MAG: outer membrane protein assembly factor BamD [Thiotrichales bacterium]